MAITFLKMFDAIQVSSVVDVVYTVPSAPNTTILRNGRVRFSNTTASAVTVKAWAVPSGGSAVDSTVCLPSTSISANAYIDVDIPVLSAGGTFRAQAGAASSVTVANLDGFLQS